MNPGSVSLRIAADHPALAGHFPNHPIVPGVVLLDEVLHAIQSQPDGQLGTASWRIAVAKFHRVVLPGQQLQLDYQAQRGGMFAFELRAAGGPVVSGTLIADGGPEPWAHTAEFSP